MATLLGSYVNTFPDIKPPYLIWKFCRIGKTEAPRPRILDRSPASSLPPMLTITSVAPNTHVRVSILLEYTISGRDSTQAVAAMNIVLPLPSLTKMGNLPIPVTLSTFQNVENMSLAVED